MWIRLSHHYEFIAIAEPLVYGRQLSEDLRSAWFEVETDLQTTIEKAYALLSGDREYQKHLSYGYASQYLAQRIVQQENADPAIAHNYWYQALQHNSLIVFSPEFCQLRWTIFCLYCQQSDRYTSLTHLVQVSRARAQTLINTCAEYGKNILNWLLEEEDSIDLWKNRKVRTAGKRLVRNF